MLLSISWSTCLYWSIRILCWSLVEYLCRLRFLHFTHRKKKLLLIVFVIISSNVLSISCVTPSFCNGKKCRVFLALGVLGRETERYKVLARYQLISWKKNHKYHIIRDTCQLLLRWDTELHNFFVSERGKHISFHNLMLTMEQAACVLIHDLRIELMLDVSLTYIHCLQFVWPNRLVSLVANATLDYNLSKREQIQCCWEVGRLELNSRCSFWRLINWEKCYSTW